MKVLVTGARGMLGEDVVEVLQKKHEVIASDITMGSEVTLDVTKPKEVLDIFEAEKPDVVVHTVGWRDVDGCEDDPQRALLINTFGAKNVALACMLNDSVMVHISTDYLYRGQEEKPVTEYCPTDPVNIYGYTKLKAEEEVIALANRFFILRLPFLFGRGGKKENNPVCKAISLLQRGEKIRATTDQICSPTHTLDIARVIEEIINTKYYGIYNVSSTGEASRYDFYLELALICGLEPSLLIPVKSITKKAQRAHYTKFNPLAFKNTFKTVPGDWRKALRECIGRINYNNN